MTLRDDLQSWLNRSDTPVNTIDSMLGLTGVQSVMIGENHFFTAQRINPSVKFLQMLIERGRFRYLANEWFLNAGPARQAVRQLVAPGGTLREVPSRRSERVLARIIPAAFGPVVAAARRRRMFVLSIGSRFRDIRSRDQRLAQHFEETMANRGLSQNAPGVFLLGAAHAGAQPFRQGSRTMRQLLQARGYRFVSVRIVSNRPLSDGVRGDLFVAMSPSNMSESFALVDMMRPGVDWCAVATRSAPGSSRSGQSPFDSVREASFATPSSIAARYEVLVVARTS